MPSVKTVLKVLAISLPLTLMVFYALALSGLAVVVLAVPGIFWVGAFLVPDGGPAVLGAAMLVLSFAISVLITSCYFWIASKSSFPKTGA